MLSIFFNNKMGENKTKYYIFILILLFMIIMLAYLIPVTFFRFTPT